MISQSYAPLGYQQLTVSGTAGGLTPPSSADTCLIVAESAVRWRDDGGTLTGSVGNLIPANNWPPFTYSGTLSAIKFIAVTGSANVNVTYYNEVG